jgi:hypothetical protein
MRSIVTPLILQITQEKVSEIIKFQTQERTLKLYFHKCNFINLSITV